MTKNPPKISSPGMISRIFPDRFQQFCIISVSGDCMHCMFKTCQVVVSISMTGQFHNFSYVIFGGILLFETSVCHVCHVCHCQGWANGAGPHPM